MSSLQKTILQKRLGSIDTDCPLCNEAKETVTHLFFECPITRLIWFGSRWSIRSDTFQVANCVDIVKLVLDPPNPSNDRFEGIKFTPICLFIRSNLEYEK